MNRHGARVTLTHGGLHEAHTARHPAEALLPGPAAYHREEVEAFLALTASAFETS